MFSGMTDKKKRMVYSKMWGSNPMLSYISIKGTPYRGEVSNNSFMFCCSGNTKKDGLKEIFGITEEDLVLLFDNKFKQACGGSGQEETRITTLHSSSLCALMFFYKISEKYPLHMKIDGEEVVFTESILEYQNKVTDTGGPSNIDITLLGTAKKHKVILFLESKFAEYILYPSKSLRIKKEYLSNVFSHPIYLNEFWKDLGLHLCFEEDDYNDEFRLISNKKVYIEGLKQMVSHYVGVRRFIEGVFHDNSNELYNNGEVERQELQIKVRQFANKDTKILLGAILFGERLSEIEINSNGETYFDNYSKMYKFLVKKLNAQLEKENISQMAVLPELLTYESLFAKPMDATGKYYTSQRIRSFYFED